MLQTVMWSSFSSGDIQLIMRLSCGASILVCLTVMAVASGTTSSTEEPTKDLFEELAFSGCYSDTEQRPTIEGRKEINKTGMSRSKCLQACAQRKYKLFGLKAGAECHCGNNLMHDRVLAKELCGMPCPGDKTQHCGGKNSMSVYKITDFNFLDKFRTEVSAAAFYGCYRDDSKQSVLLNVIEKRDLAMSGEMCRNHCTRKQMKLYGLKAGTICYCGSGLRNDAVNEDGKCNSECTGNRAEKCGGPRHTEIYQILRIGNFQLPKPPMHSDEL